MHHLQEHNGGGRRRSSDEITDDFDDMTWITTAADEKKWQAIEDSVTKYAR